MIDALKSALKFRLRIPVCGVLGSGCPETKRAPWVGKERQTCRRHAVCSLQALREGIAMIAGRRMM
ncbi:uncharacterized protein K441DRAFT_659762 [Cenococcum geophilum 1.58]|uniref:uncharacterized protein n=1 Tax=Cenococcum geophilum 1.58 TaxID=794803 RepID=UPI00358E1EBC|nr:hypothetical protein K441DRAFT_659762 [Cenococcum geophilum 1.58]